MPKTLITGCDLYVEAEGKWVHGDLWEVGGTYVFNACLKDGEAAWQRGVPNAYQVLLISILESFSQNYFERRGVIVVEKRYVMLNDNARVYIGRQ